MLVSLPAARRHHRYFYKTMTMFNQRTASDTATRGGHDPIMAEFQHHSSSKRIHTLTHLAGVIREEYPDQHLVITPDNKTDLFGYASANKDSSLVTCQPGLDPVTASSDVLAVTQYRAPNRRTEEGNLVQSLVAGKYVFHWKGEPFLVYFIDGRDGVGSYPQDKFFYIIHRQKDYALALVKEVGIWTNELHDQIWIFDGGYWQKSADLFKSIQHASWDQVILDEKMKQALKEEHLSFFRSKEVFQKLQVPWKRGLLYYGPPGNGKTISIKATMSMLYSLKVSVPTLYVRTLTSYGGPEQSVHLIFEKARSMAPCYVVFEDLDTIVTDVVKSYFFNEVDGLASNDGIFMIGSTNHLDRLDPGISQRPSRFDRKYFFPDPSKEQRIDYCHFWQRKLQSNKDIEFPDVLCEAIAGITDKFSFAYLQEAFVATLLAIAKDEEPSKSLDGELQSLHVAEDRLTIDVPTVDAEGDNGDDGEDGGEDEDDLDKYKLWREIKKQVEILRQGLGQDSAA